MGRNLLRYQLIELRLKALLPLMCGRMELSAAGFAELQRALEELAEDSLGPLTTALVAKLAGESSEVERYRQALVLIKDRRNFLVHKVLQRVGPWNDISVQAECYRLDAEHAGDESTAKWIAELLAVYRRHLALAVDLACADSDEERASILSGKGFVRSATAPVALAVVEALNAMSAEHENGGGWWSLADAGNELQLRGCPLPARTKLLKLLRDSSDEFELRQDHAGWHYRVWPRGSLVITPVDASVQLGDRRN